MPCQPDSALAKDPGLPSTCHKGQADRKSSLLWGGFMTAARPGHQSALLFDLDGTLVHSLPDMAGALNSLLEELTLPALEIEEVRLMIGDGIPALVHRALEAEGRAAARLALEEAEIVQRFRAHYRARLTRETRPYPGVVETLSRLRDGGWSMAVCTNKAETPAREIIDDLGLARFFDGLAGGDTYAAAKPAADPLLGLAEVLGRPSRETVMVGDSPADVGAARNAGMAVVAVSYGYRKVPAEALGADALIHRFDDLPAALSGLVEGAG